MGSPRQSWKLLLNLLQVYYTWCLAFTLDDWLTDRFLVIKTLTNLFKSSMISTGSSRGGCTTLNCAIYYLQHVFFFLFFPLVDDVQNVQIVCVWCQKEGVKRYSLCMGSELKSFCSEKCFAACRRAYFKRNKVSGKKSVWIIYITWLCVTLQTAWVQYIVHIFVLYYRKFLPMTSPHTHQTSSIKRFLVDNWT